MRTSTAFAVFPAGLFLLAVTVAQAVCGEDLVQTYKLPVTAATPAIDGKLDEACWKQALVISDFRLLGGKGKPTAGTRARMLLGPRDLLLAITCDEPCMERLKTTVTRRDGPVWGDDCIEFFLDPDADSVSYHHWIISAAGTVYDAYRDRLGQSHKEWNSHVRTAVTRAAGQWTLEAAIPLSELESLGTPGRAWRFHLARERKAINELITALRSPVVGFHVPEFFDRLIVPAPAVSLFPLRNIAFDIEKLVGENRVLVTGMNASAKSAKFTLRVVADNRASPPVAVTTQPGRRVRLETSWTAGSTAKGHTVSLVVTAGAGNDPVFSWRTMITAMPPVIDAGHAPHAIFAAATARTVMRFPLHLAAGTLQGAAVEVSLMRGRRRLDRWRIPAAGGRIEIPLAGQDLGPGHYSLRLRVRKERRTWGELTHEFLIVDGPFSG